MIIVALFPELVSTTGNSHITLKMTRNTNALHGNIMAGYGYEVSDKIGNKITGKIGSAGYSEQLYQPIKLHHIPEDLDL
jgi:hypothetical protein